MRPRCRSCLPALGSTLNKADLDQIGFIDILYCPRLFSDRDSDCLQANRTTTEIFRNHPQNATVQVIKPKPVDAEKSESVGCDLFCDFSVSSDEGIVPYSPEKPVCNTRCPPASAGNFPACFRSDIYLHDGCTPRNDQNELVR